MFSCGRIDCMKDKLILDIIEKHTSNTESNKVGANRQLITLSVPAEYKEDFEKLQNATNKQFVKAVKEVVLKTIDIGKTKVAI